MHARACLQKPHSDNLIHVHVHVHAFVIQDLIDALIPSLIADKPFLTAKEALCSYMNEKLVDLSSQGKMAVTGVNLTAGMCIISDYHVMPTMVAKVFQTNYKRDNKFFH